MGDFEEETNKIITSWHTAFKKGTDFDLWGQPVEAIDVYLRLARQLQQQANPEAEMFGDEQKKVLGKIATCLSLRCTALQKPGKVDGISLDDLRRIETSLKNLLSTSSREFPVSVVSSSSSNTAISHGLLEEIPDAEPTVDGEDEDILDQSDANSKGTLLPPPAPIEGKTFLAVRIEKIGLKDCLQYLNPFIVISVKDSAGVDLTPAQETPVVLKKQEPHIMFGVDVHIQRALDFLPNGYAIFFEFKHYKPKKRKTSTKCWAVLEKDEVKEGPAVVELYKKPADYRRKAIHLLTVKPLYLHLKLELSTG